MKICIQVSKLKVICTFLMPWVKKTVGDMSWGSAGIKVSGIDSVEGE